MDNNRPAKLLKGGVVLGQSDSLDAVVVESRELRNQKRYTVRELLASDEAMKDLLHERLLAVRDDLNFAINACNPSAAVNGMRQNIQAVERAIRSIGGTLRSIEDGIKHLEEQGDSVNVRLVKLERAMQRQPRWWKSAWAKLKKRVR